MMIDVPASFFTELLYLEFPRFYYARGDTLPANAYSSTKVHTCDKMGYAWAIGNHPSDYSKFRNPFIEPESDF